MKRAFVFAFVALFAAVAVANDGIVKKLQESSFTIKAGGSQGSGSAITRTIENKDITFIVTAAHVIDHLKRTRKVTIEGVEKKVIDFDDVDIVQEFQDEGRKVGEVRVAYRVLRYSDSELGHDIALLQVRKTNFTKATTEFYLEDNIPALGTEFYHVGSLLGQVGSNSLTTGILSQTGRVLNLAGGQGVVFDQTTATAYPDSSGGGMYLKSDGRYVGTLVRGAGETFNLIVPVRRLRVWAKEAKVEWVLDPTLKQPTLEELAKINVADTPDVRNSFDLGRFFKTQDSLKYPTLISGASEPRPDSVSLPE